MVCILLLLLFIITIIIISSSSSSNSSSGGSSSSSGGGGSSSTSSSSNLVPCRFRFNCIRVFLNPVNVSSNTTYTAKSRKFQCAILLWEREAIFEILFYIKEKEQDGGKCAGGVP
jgi:hypothetical protein